VGSGSAKVDAKVQTPLASSSASGSVDSDGHISVSPNVAPTHEQATGDADSMRGLAGAAPAGLGSTTPGPGIPELAVTHDPAGIPLLAPPAFQGATNGSHSAATRSSTTTSIEISRQDVFPGVYGETIVAAGTTPSAPNLSNSLLREDTSSSASAPARPSAPAPERRTPVGAGAGGVTPGSAGFFWLFALSIGLLLMATPGLCRWLRHRPDLTRPPSLQFLLERPG
jgi:hypothetical protein